MSEALQTMKANWFYSAAYSRLHSGWNWMLAICGPTGMGKSYAGLRLAFDLDLSDDGERRFPLDASRVIFRVEDFIDFVRQDEELPAGSFLMLDESALSLNSQRWWELQAQAMSGMTQSFRCRNLGSIFCFPGSLGFLNKQVRQLCHTALVMRSVNKQAGFSCGDFRHLQTNIFSGKIYRHTPEAETPGGDEPLDNFKFFLPPKQLVEAYEARKASFLKEFYNGLADELAMAKAGIYSKRIDLTGFYNKVLENPTYYMDAKQKHFVSAVLRVRFGLTENNASQLAEALNVDWKAKRIKAKQGDSL